MYHIDVIIVKYFSGRAEPTGRRAGGDAPM